MKETDALRRQLVELAPRAAMRTSILTAALKGLPAKLRGVNPRVRRTHGLAIVGAHQDCPVGHSGVQPESETRFAALAGGILAEDGSAAERGRLEQKHEAGSRGFGSHAEVGYEQEERLVSSHSARPRSNAAAGGAVGGGSQRLPRRATGFAAAIAGAWKAWPRQTEEQPKCISLPTKLCEDGRARDADWGSRCGARKVGHDGDAFSCRKNVGAHRRFAM